MYITNPNSAVGVCSCYGILVLGQRHFRHCPWNIDGECLLVVIQISYFDIVFTDPHQERSPIYDVDVQDAANG